LWLASAEFRAITLLFEEETAAVADCNDKKKSQERF